MSQTAFSLIVCLPNEEPIRHDLTGEAMSIGRSPENDIQVLAAEVSVKHGRIERVGDGFSIIDSGSTNGTQVNSKALGSSGVALNPMDQIVLGTVVPCYFVPTAVVETTPLAELVASLSAASAAPVRAATAPIATAAPGAPVRAAVPVGRPPAASPEGATIKLDQVRPPAAPGVKPGVAPVPIRQPLPGVPTAPAAPAGVPPKAPVAPVKVAPGVPPKAPGVAPAAVPPRAPVAPAKVAPGVPPKAPGVAPAAGAPSAPRPVPIKPPSRPSIPLPKAPPKPGGN